MAKRFLNITEKTLISLVKKVMKKHKPLTGFRRAFFNAIRHISTGRKPHNSHGLSLLVTEDLFVDITSKFDTADVSSAFMNVMALADEEVIEHYQPSTRAPVFVEMLNEARAQIRRGNLVSRDWGIDTFCMFIDQYFQTHSMRFNAEHLRQALEILMSPNGYRILTVNWLLMRLIAAAYVVSASKAHGNRELMYTAASTAASMEDTDNGAFAALLVNADERALREMMAAERTCMVNLYGGILLGSYVDEVQHYVTNRFNKENRILSYVMKACSAALVPIGRVSMMFYCGSMFGAIIQQMSGEVPINNTAFCTTYDRECGSAGTSASVDVSGITASDCLAQLQTRFGTDFTCPVPNVVTWADIVRDASKESMKMANLSAVPASMAVLTVIYLSMPLVVFSDYVSEWIGRRTAARLDESKFVPPNKFSLYSVTGIIKLLMNTFMTMTAHLSNRLFSALINWTVTRAYFPLSLIEQPLKTTSFFNVAMSAASSTRHVRIVPSTAKCIAAAVIAIPFEYTGHSLQKWQMLHGQELSSAAYAAVTGFVFVMKLARIAAMFGPILVARHQRRNLPFSSQFEKVFWYDGIRCFTAPLVLLMFEWASGNLLRTTIAFTFDSLVSYVPDMMCGSVLDSLSNAGGRIAALESWIEENFQREDVVAQLATVTSMETVPGGACGTLEKVLEKHFKKDVVEDHGMDLVLDNFGGFRDTEENWQSAHLRVRKGNLKAASLADAVNADVKLALRRGAKKRGLCSDISSSTESISTDSYGAYGRSGCEEFRNIEERRSPGAPECIVSGKYHRGASSSGIGADDTVEEYRARGNRSFAELVLHIVAMDRQKPRMRRVRKVYPSCGDDRFSFDDFRHAFDFLAEKAGIFGNRKCASEEQVGLLSAADDDDEVRTTLINNPYVDTDVVNGTRGARSLFKHDEDFLGVLGPRTSAVSRPAASGCLQRSNGKNHKDFDPCGGSVQPSAPVFVGSSDVRGTCTPRQKPGTAWGGYVNHGFASESPPPYKSPSPEYQFMYGGSGSVDVARPVSVGHFSKYPAGTERSPLQMEDIPGCVFSQRPQETYHASTEGQNPFDFSCCAAGGSGSTRVAPACSGNVTPIFSELAGFRPTHSGGRRASQCSTPMSQYDAEIVYPAFGRLAESAPVQSPSGRIVNPQCIAATADFCRFPPSENGVARVLSPARSHRDGGYCSPQHFAGSYVHFDAIGGVSARPTLGSQTVGVAANDLQQRFIHGVPCTQLSSVFSSEVANSDVHHMLG